MSDAKENKEAGQGVPSAQLAAEESQPLVDAQVQVQTEASSSLLPIKETSNHGENGKAESPAKDESVEPGKAVPPAEDESMEPGKPVPPVVDNSVKPEKAEPPAVDGSVEPGRAVPPAEDNSLKPEKAEPPAVDESMEPRKAVPPVEDNSMKPEKAEPPAEDESMEPGKAVTPAEDNSVKPEKVEPPAGDESVKPGKTVPPAEDDSMKPGKEELPVEDKNLKQGKADQPAEDNSVKPEKAGTSVEDNSVMQGKADQPAEDNSVKPEKAGISAEDNCVKQGKADKPAEDNSMKSEAVSEGIPKPDVQKTPQSVPVEADAKILNGTECEEASGTKMEAEEFTHSNKVVENDNNVCGSNVDAAEVKPEGGAMVDTKTCNNGVSVPVSHNEPTMPLAVPAVTKAEIKNELKVENKVDKKQAAEAADNGNSNSKHMCFLDADHSYDGNESGTEEEQSAFMKELENFFRERSMEFKPPKFYGEGLNCLKLWRAVTRLGGYDKVTSCKLWRQVGESFKPPKTCTTVSWTFRGFYEKALLDYERHKIKGGELNVPIASHPEPMNIENQCTQASASGRARRDAAARAMQGWHSQRLLGNGEVSDPIIKDRNSVSMQKREKQPKGINLSKRKRPAYMDNDVRAARSKLSKPQLDTAVVDIGPPADWVKVNVQKTKDCFEVYALVPGLLREEVRVQSDPAGRLVISGEPEHPNNPWGVTPFKKVVSLPSRIDPHQTSAVVTLHGQLFVRVPFEQSE